jgi:hypothetical protein
VRILVSELSGIRREFSGKLVSRSYKNAASREYITYVCVLADPEIGPGTIEEAMKRTIQRRNAMDELRED